MLNTIKKAPSLLRAVLLCAGIVVIIMGIQFASPVISPIVISISIAVLCMPIFSWLQRKGLPIWLALILMVLGLFICGGVLLFFAYLSLRQLDDKLPYYQQRLTALINECEAWLLSIGVRANDLQGSSLFDPSAVIGIISRSLNSLLGIFTSSFLVLLGVFFTLLEAPFLKIKLVRSLGEDNFVLRLIENFSHDMQQFIYLRALNNLIVAIGGTILLLVFRIDFAFLWGLLIFFLSFIPNIGIVIACIPAVALALLQYGLLVAIIVTVGLVVINLIGDNILTPRLMSSGLNLSAFTVFFSFVLWAWLLGPVGALLSVPLTLFVSLLLAANKDTEWIAQALGSNKNIKRKEAEAAIKSYDVTDD